jgi:hypothetical protein
VATPAAVVVAVAPDEQLTGVGVSSGHDQIPVRTHSLATPNTTTVSDGTGRQVPLWAERRDGPYTGYTDKGYPDPRAASPANVRDAVLDILKADGPLPKASIYALYRDGCPHVERAGKALRHAINSAIAVLQRGRQVIVIDEGTIKDPSEVVVRLTEQPHVTVRPRGARQIEGIPLSELATVFRQLSPERPSTTSETIDLQRRVLEQFDLRNLTERAKMRLNEAQGLAFDEQFWTRLGAEAALPL